MKTISSIVLTTLAIPGALNAQEPRGVPGDSILTGTVYNVFHSEYATDQEFFHAVDRDIPAIAAAHLKDVMIFPMSQWDPATRQLRWTRTDYLVRKIEENHLKFVPLLLKEEQCGSYFPIWKFRELGLWSASDVDNGNPNNRENVDFADPRVYPLVEDYIRQVVGRYGHSPALDFYNVWNEPHYSSTAPHVVERFRGWLLKKYGSLGALNRSWGDDYDDWRDVSPFLNDDWDSSMPQTDWTLFRNELDGDLLGRLTALVRSLDPVHPVNANPVGTPFATFGGFGGYNTDNWQFTPYDDFNGASYYPDAWARDHGLNRAPQWFHDLSFDVFRCAAEPKDYILTELYTNAKSGLTLGGYLDADTAREIAWTALANDCKGILWWKWQPFMRGRQSLGRGLTRLDGSLAPRGQAVRDFASVIEQHGRLLRAARLERPQAAIVVDMAGLLKVLQQQGEPRTQTFMYRDIAGVFRALDGANIPVDILRADLGLRTEELRRYKVLILPFQVVMRRETARELEDYVRAGGCVIADARTATLDELDFAYAKNPGGGLDGLFAAERSDWIALPKTFGVHVNAPGVWAGGFDGVDFRENLRVGPEASVEGVFDDDRSPALVRHRFGRGTAWLSAVPLGAGAFEKGARSAADLIVTLCRSAGVTPPADYVSASPQLPMIRVHDRGDERVVYVVNAGGEALSGDLRLAYLPGKGPVAVVDLLTGRVLADRSEGAGIRVPLALPAEGVAVLHLKRR